MSQVHSELILMTLFKLFCQILKYFLQKTLYNCFYKMSSTPPDELIDLYV